MASQYEDEALDLLKQADESPSMGTKRALIGLANAKLLLALLHQGEGKMSAGKAMEAAAEESRKAGGAPRRRTTH